MSRTTQVLVTGGEGQLAQALRPYFPTAHYLGRKELDVTNSQQVRAVFDVFQPALIIHCAAVTAHNAAPMAYLMGNVYGTVNVVGQASRCKARLVYPSTDYLGTAAEDGPVQPVNAYAASKYAGELAARLYPNALVCRGSWYSRLDYPVAATDAYTSKVPVTTAAGWIAQLSTSSYTGVVNVAGPRRSIYEIVATEFNPKVRAVSRQELRLPYQIPADCSLDSTRMRAWGCR